MSWVSGADPGQLIPGYKECSQLASFQRPCGTVSRSFKAVLEIGKVVLEVALCMLAPGACVREETGVHGTAWTKQKFTRCLPLPQGACAHLYGILCSLP